MFLKGDQERAEKEIDCYNYCLENADRHFENNNFGKAARYLENAKRSLDELDRMYGAKQTMDKAWLRLKQIEGEQDLAKLLSAMRLGQ